MYCDYGPQQGVAWYLRPLEFKKKNQNSKNKEILEL
jgi:hypothetical protein